MTERIFRYIPHRLRAAYEAAGWVASELGPPHGEYSCLMEFVGDGDPVEPDNVHGGKQ
jgi:hypothetical protein